MPDVPVDLNAGDLQFTRRRLLASAAACLAAAACADLCYRDNAAAEVVDLAGFMRLSRVLTGIHELTDQGAGRVYLDALLADPAEAERLALLWIAAGFADAAPVDVEELAARGVYADPELAALADTITRYWYTGVYDVPGAGPKVATYGGALAWRTLDYRAAGPSFCGGAFGPSATRTSLAIG